MQESLSAGLNASARELIKFQTLHQQKCDELNEALDRLRQEHKEEKEQQEMEEVLAACMCFQCAVCSLLACHPFIHSFIHSFHFISLASGVT